MFLCPTLAKADIFITKTKHTDEMVVMGQVQPAKDEQGILWMASDRMRDDTGDTSTITRFDLNKIYIINNKDKTYSEIDLPVDFDKSLPAEAKQWIQMMLVTATVTDTATFLDPHQFPKGIEFVIVNGQIAVEKGGHTGILAGKVLRKR